MKHIRLALLVSATAVLLGLAAEPAAAQDCTSCGALDSCTCTSDPTSSACRCVIKIHYGTCFCVERDFLCSGLGSCSSDPPPLIVPPTMEIEPKALEKLSAQEPLLSTALLGVVEVNKEKRSVLNLEPYAHGTMSGKLGRYHHRGIFTLRGEGQAAFHIVLESAEGGSTITYSGLIRDRGRSITYSKRTKLGLSDRLEKFEWTAAD